jgi:hypothetical protein
MQSYKIRLHCVRIAYLSEGSYRGFCCYNVSTVGGNIFIIVSQNVPICPKRFGSSIDSHC